MSEAKTQTQRRYTIDDYAGVRPGQLRHDLVKSAANRVPIYVLVHSLDVLNDVARGMLCVVSRWQWHDGLKQWLGSQVINVYHGDRIVLTPDEVKAMPIVSELNPPAGEG